MRCRQQNRALDARIGEEEKRQRRETDAEMTRWRRKRLNDYRSDEERRQNAISNRTASILIPYSDARSINIQLHQDRVALSILLPFSRSLLTNTHSRPHSHRNAPEGYGVSEGLTEDGKKRREEAECMYRRQSTVCKVDGGIYNNVCRPRFKSTPVGIDLWSWDANACLLTSCAVATSSALAPFPRYLRVSRFLRVEIFFMKKAFSISIFNAHIIYVIKIYYYFSLFLYFLFLYLLYFFILNWITLRDGTG